MTSISPLSRLDLNEQAYLAIRQRVLTREIGPWEQLNLRTLAEDLRVSRSPVLHAVTRLVAEGLVVTESRRGFYVKPLTVDDVESAHDFRLLLELFVAERVVPTISDEDLVTLRRLKDDVHTPRSADEPEEREAYVVAHQAFHQFIIDLCRNPFISDSYRQLAAHLTSVRMLADHQGGHPMGARSIQAHEEIVAAFEARDAERAKLALRYDLEAGALLAVQLIREAGGVL